MSAITAKASRKMKKYAVLTREPRCFLGSFDFSWEQRNFADVVQIERGGSPRPIDDYITDSQNGLNWVKIGDAPAQGHYITKTAEKIRPEGLSKTREVHPGDLILSNSMSFGKPYIMGIDGCIHDGWLLIRDTNSTFDLTFLCHLLGTPQMLDQYRSLAAGSTVNNLNKELVGNTVVTIPTIDEQRVLGQYLERLDNLITLHQRKCANLCSPSQVVFSLLFATSTFSWEQRKLSEITDKVTEKNAGLQYVETFTNSAEFGIISQRDFFDHDIAKLGSLDGYYIVKNEDFVYNPRISTSAPVGPINRNKLGRTGVMSPLYTVFRPHDIDTTYLEYFFKCGYWHSFMNFNGDSGARSDRFSIRDNVFFQMPIPIPDIDEQRKIGELLTCLDNLITLHQRECISFTGRADRLILTANKKRTTSSWEQRKLGDIADIVGGGTPSTGNQSYWDGDIDWYAPAEIADQIYANSSQKKITGLGYENSSAKMLPPGTVLFTSRAGIGKTAILTRKGCTNQGFQSIVPHRGELDSYFIFSRTEELKRYGELVGAGSTFVEVSGKQMAVMELMMPPTMREQQTIGGFFQQLDHLITLHQRKPFLMKWRTSDANRNQTNRLVL